MLTQLYEEGLPIPPELELPISDPEHPQIEGESERESERGSERGSELEGGSSVARVLLGESPSTTVLG
jgi:hypothetical protein